MRICTRILFSVLVAVILPLVAHAADPAELLGRDVVRIDISGLSTIEETTVRGALTEKVGAPLTRAGVQTDIHGIFALGFFRDVTVDAEPQGGQVVLGFRLREWPTLSEVTFKGNKKIIKDTLTSATAGLSAGGFLVPEKLIRGRAAVLGEYADSGFRRATVVPVQEVHHDEETGADMAALTFVIEEHEKTKISKISFEGNEAFSDHILKKRLKTKKRFWLTSWVTDSGVYKPAQVADDLLRIEEYYQDHGYYDVVVPDPGIDLSDDLRWQTLTYRVDEGQPYRVGQVDYQHADKVPEAVLTKGLEVLEGTPYNRSLVRSDRGHLTDTLGEHGYAFAQVMPNLTPDPETGTLDVTFNLREGEQVQIRRINISGNTKTRDKVIRREVRQQEGEIINTALLRRSFQRINNLNYFENIDIVPVEVSPGQLDLDVRVKEKSTGQFSVGGGFSSVDGLVGLAEVTQANLGGRGQSLSGRFERSGRRTIYNLKFREPHLLDSSYSAGFDLFNTVRDFDSYEETRTGGSVNTGKAIGEFIHGSLSYSFETLDINILTSSAPVIITSQSGHSTTSSIGFSLSRDNRDNFMDPRSGTRNVLSAKVAGAALGGSNQFLKGSLESSIYFPVFKASSISFRNLIGGASGYGSKEVPPGERFFVGGIRTVRGFDFGEAGPLALNGDPIGGTKEWVMSAELAFPLVKAAHLKGALFMDWGASFDSGESIATSDMNLTWGYEIRWISPLGPLRIGFGWVLDDQRPAPFQNGGQQLFTIGTFF